MFAALLALALPAGAQNVAVSTFPVSASTPAVHIDADQADQLLAELEYSLRRGSYTLADLPPGGKKDDGLAELTFELHGSRWCSLTLTRRQWESWERKAQAWKEDAFLRELYGGDTQRFFGSVKGKEIAAIVDVLAVELHRRFPNAFTRALDEGFQAAEKITREIPIELRADARDYLAERYKTASAYLPFGRHDALLAPDHDDRPEYKPPKEETLEELWKRFDPKVKLNVTPHWKLSDPGVDVGGGLDLRLSERWRLKLGGDFDSRDRSAAGTGGLFADW